LALRTRTGASIIALTRSGVTESNPAEKTTLLAGDIVVLLGARDEIRRAMGFILANKDEG
jgi:monovalent cation:H+ antiporter-2, CPA2 family